MRRIPLRIQKGYNRYTVKTGDAGFVQLFLNGKRIMPKNKTIVFNLRRLADNPLKKEVPNE